MEKVKIIDLVKDRIVQFDSYRAGIFYYNLYKMNDDGYDERHVPEVYQFQVPLEDIGDATLLKEDKAILFMRYIRKSIETNTLIKL